MGHLGELLLEHTMEMGKIVCNLTEAEREYCVREDSWDKTSL